MALMKTLNMIILLTHLYFDQLVSKSKLKDFDQFCAILYDGERYCLGNLIDINIEVKKGFCPDDNHPHAIDLGLPSGNKWACCDLGCSNPLKDFTGYKIYPWGYITPVISTKYHYLTDYKYSGEVIEESYYHLCSSGYVYLGDDISGTEYDAVYMNKQWKEGWVMPNVNDFYELVLNCKIEEFNNDDIYDGFTGYRIIGPNGNYIEKNFLYWWYWSSTLAPTNTIYPVDFMSAYSFDLSSWYSNNWPDYIYHIDYIEYNGIIRSEIRNFPLHIWPVYKR